MRASGRETAKNRLSTTCFRVVEPASGDEGQIEDGEEARGRSADGRNRVDDARRRREDSAHGVIAVRVSHEYAPLSGVYLSHVLIGESAARALGQAR